MNQKICVFHTIARGSPRPFGLTLTERSISIYYSTLYKCFCQYFSIEKFYRFSDYLFKSPQMSERLGISSISGILRFGRYPAYHGISEPHLALKSSKTVVETAAYYYAASLSIAAFAEV